MKQPLTVHQIPGDQGHDDILHVAISGDNFAAKIEVVAVCNPPVNSIIQPASTKYLELLSKSAASVTVDNLLKFCGDFNARIGKLCPEEQEAELNPHHGKVVTMRLHNVVRKVNSRVKELLEFCNVFSLVPLNGLDIFGTTFPTRFTSGMYAGIPSWITP